MCGAAGHAHSAPDVIKPSLSISVGEKKCTMGFVLATSSGAARGLTAKHCGEEGSPVTTASGERVGVILEEAPGDYDVSLVRIQSELTVYSDVDRIGPVEDLITIDDLNTIRPLLCKKGATTGLSCGPLIGEAKKGWFVFAADAEHGDSGSPVYALSRTGRLLAAGILEGHDKQRPDHLVVTPIQPFLAAWELQIVR